MSVAVVILVLRRARVLRENGLERVGFLPFTVLCPSRSVVHLAAPTSSSCHLSFAFRENEYLLWPPSRSPWPLAPAGPPRYLVPTLRHLDGGRVLSLAEISHRE